MTDLELVFLALITALAVAAVLARATRRRKLREQHRLLNRLPMASLALDSAQRIRHWNPQMARLTQLSPSAALGRSIQQLPEPWQAALGEFVASPGDVSQRFGAGALHVVLHKGLAKVVDPLVTIILIEDRSAQHRLEQELAHTNRLAAIGELAAGVAHEIGNPITAIDSLAQLLPPQAAEQAQLIRSQTQRINQIISGLLKFSTKSDSSTTRQPFSTHTLINDSLRLFKLDPEHDNAHLDVDLGSDLQLVGDPVGLSQVLINLLRNAAQAQQPGVALSIQVRADNDAARWQLTVTDNGRGIAPALQARIFEPFVSTRTDEGGTGLGLALCYGIASSHHGTITVASPVANHRGTTMTLTLPRS